ncbi:MAG: hypothetical protein KKD38_05355, partial [Candidatus Delongbacteria bacterium]|nr:hypothetical protein [Candidatus Delongbacteria bacterium]
KISAADSCYICYYSDTLSVKETMLLPGKILAIKAERIIEAKLGKSGAVDLEFNKNKILKELKELINASSIIQVTYKGAERIKRSEKISEYLKNTYGLE